MIYQMHCRWTQNIINGREPLPMFVNNYVPLPIHLPGQIVANISPDATAARSLDEQRIQQHVDTHFTNSEQRASSSSSSRTSARFVNAQGMQQLLEHVHRAEEEDLLNPRNLNPQRDPIDLLRDLPFDFHWFFPNQDNNNQDFLAGEDTTHLGILVPRDGFVSQALSPDVDYASRAYYVTLVYAKQLQRNLINYYRGFSSLSKAHQEILMKTNHPSDWMWAGFVLSERDVQRILNSSHFFLRTSDCTDPAQIMVWLLSLSVCVCTIVVLFICFFLH